MIRYQGQRSGREISTPAQYARLGEDVIFLVGRPESKTWWRNFAEDRDLAVLLQGQWMTFTARAIRGATEQEEVARLLDAYIERFPRATRVLGGGTGDEQLRRTVLVLARRTS